MATRYRSCGQLGIVFAFFVLFSQADPVRAREQDEALAVRESTSSANPNEDGEFCDLPGAAGPGSRYVRSVVTPGPIYPVCPSPTLSWYDDQSNQGYAHVFEAPPVAWRPVYYFYGDFAPLTRDTPKDFVVATRSARANTALSTADLDPGFNAGGSFLFGWRFLPNAAVEGSYLGFHSWADSAGIRDNTANAQGGLGNLFSPLSKFGQPPTVGTDFNDFVSIGNAANFHNAELNLLTDAAMPPGPLALNYLVGARFLSIGERFNFLSETHTGGAAAQSVDVTTRNRLLGLQLGFQTKWLVSPRAWIDFEAKSALAVNRGDQDTLYGVTTAGTRTNFVTERSRDLTSWVGDLKLQTHYELFPGVHFRAGYQAIFISGLATAEQNFQQDPLILQFGPGQLRSMGTTVYHGPFVGLAIQR